MNTEPQEPPWSQIRTLFEAAADMPRDQRESLVRREAGDRPALAAAVLALLREADAAGSTNDLVHELRLAATVDAAEPSTRSFAPLPDEIEARFYTALLGGDPAGVDARVADVCMDAPPLAPAVMQRLQYFRSSEFLGADGEDLLRRIRKVWSGARHTERHQHVRDLGEGGFGTVSVLRDRVLGRKVACKTLRSRWGTALHLVPPEIGHRFLDELQVAAQLLHPSIPLVHDVGVTPAGVPFFTMRLILGQTLADVLQRSARGDPAWPRHRLLRVLLDVADAVDYAHGQNVVHRDLKPLNVLVGRFGESCVLDWGLSHARRLESSRRPAAGVAVDRIARLWSARGGSPGFTAPEQWDGEVHPASDVYSIGAILHVLLYGVPPPVRLARDAQYTLPPAQERQDRRLVAVCERALAPDMRRRSRTMREFREALAACVAAPARPPLWRRIMAAWRPRPPARGTARSEMPAAEGADRAWEALRPESAQLSLAHRPASIALATPGTQTSSVSMPRDGDEPSPRHAGVRRRLEVVRRLGVASGCFEPRRKIGAGGMSEVWLCRDARLGRDVAIKFSRHPTAASWAGGKAAEWLRNLAPGSFASEDDSSSVATELSIIARSLDEPQISGQLDHPALLAPHDVGVDAAGRFFLVMPFVSAGTLHEQARALGAGSWRKTCGLLLQAARGLAHAHERNVLHRDVKPTNIFVGAHGDAHLADWGLALVLGPATPSDSDATHVQRGEDFDYGGRRAATVPDETPGTIVGTPAYMSPEQARGEVIGPTSDVFSLGATLFELLTGSTRFRYEAIIPRNSGAPLDQRESWTALFDNRNTRAMLETIQIHQHPSVASCHPRAPRLVAAVCDRAVQSDPKLRFRDAGEFALALEGALARSQ